MPGQFSRISTDVGDPGLPPRYSVDAEDALVNEGPDYFCLAFGRRYVQTQQRIREMANNDWLEPRFGNNSPVPAERSAFDDQSTFDHTGGSTNNRSWRRSTPIPTWLRSFALFASFEPTSAMFSAGPWVMFQTNYAGNAQIGWQLRVQSSGSAFAFFPHQFAASGQFLLKTQAMSAGSKYKVMVTFDNNAGDAFLYFDDFAAPIASKTDFTTTSPTDPDDHMLFLGGNTNHGFPAYFGCYGVVPYVPSLIERVAISDNL